MCPKGHELLQRSDYISGRWAWAWHARRCGECAEVRTAERFVVAYATRAGSWPVPGNLLARCTGQVGVQAPPRPARRWTRAVGAAIVVVLLAPLAGMVMRRPGPRALSNGTVARDSKALQRALDQNAKLIALAFCMYTTEYPAYPDVKSDAALREVMAPYLERSDTWYKPGTKEVVVTYLLPAGLTVANIKNPSKVPMLVITCLPNQDIVGYADGHVQAFPKKADWGQKNVPKE